MSHTDPTGPAPKLPPVEGKAWHKQDLTVTLVPVCLECSSAHAAHPADTPTPPGQAGTTDTVRSLSHLHRHTENSQMLVASLVGSGADFFHTHCLHSYVNPCSPGMSPLRKTSLFCCCQTGLSHCHTLVLPYLQLPGCQNSLQSLRSFWSQNPGSP